MPKLAEVSGPNPEYELRVRVRELEAERDRAASRLSKVEAERDAYRNAYHGLRDLLVVLDSGKA